MPQRYEVLQILAKISDKIKEYRLVLYTGIIYFMNNEED